MIEAFPLQWPVNKPRTPKEKRKPANFGTTTKHKEYNYREKNKLSVYEACMRIQKELYAYTRVGHPLRVPKQSIIISTNVPVKKDGMPYSNAKEPDDCGAAVYFELDKKAYCLPCDKWDRLADNLAAIAAHLNAMRGIERWGVGESHDVFTGFAALPETSSFLSRSMWEILGLPGKPANVNDVHEAYKQQAKKVHPDTGGSDDLFHELQTAYKNAKQMF